MATPRPCASLMPNRIDLKAEATIAYGAPPLLAAKTISGEMDATINYWNFCAAMEAKGFHRLAGVVHRFCNLVLEGLKFFRERMAGFFYSMMDHFGFRIHWTFSFRLLMDSSGRR